MSSTGESMQPKSSGNASPLAWQDVNPDQEATQTWWLSRASDEAGMGEFFVVEDQLSGYLVGVVRAQPGNKFEMIAALRLDQAPPGRAATLAGVKALVDGWRAIPRTTALRQGVSRWRRRRSGVIARANLPLAAGAFLTGGMLGFAVAMFAVSSGAVGPPILLVGVLIGAVTGSFLKFIADRKPAPGNSLALAGSWGRFAVVSVAALIGAGLASAGVLTVLWR